MAALPEEGITISRPFHSTGANFANPIDIKRLEETSDLFTETFLAKIDC